MHDADREILDHFIGIRGKTLAMLAAVPDELLTRTAEAEQHPIGWQFAHIASGVDWWLEYVMQDGLGWSQVYPSEKEAIARSLVASRDRLVSLFSAGDGEPMARIFSLSEEKKSENGTEWVGRSRVL